MDKDILAKIPNYALTAWGLRNTQKRPSQDGLTIAKIIDAAIIIARKEGLKGLSIRKLSKKLNFTTMAIYRHVASRDELVILMVDTALGQPPEAVRTAATWQNAFSLWGWALLGKYQADPWLLEAPVGPPKTPNNMLWLEYVLEGTAHSKLTLQERLDSALTIDGHARNFAHIATQQPGPTEPDNPSWLIPLITPSRFPLFSEVIAQEVLTDDEGPNFAFGLDRIIKGIETFAK